MDARLPSQYIPSVETAEFKGQEQKLGMSQKQVLPDICTTGQGWEVISKLCGVVVSAQAMRRLMSLDNGILFPTLLQQVQFQHDKKPRLGREPVGPMPHVKQHTGKHLHTESLLVPSWHRWRQVPGLYLTQEYQTISVFTAICLQILIFIQTWRNTVVP